MATKTITLTGAEVAVTGLDGSNAAIRNDGADVIYVGRTPGITSGADGVMSIHAGQSAVVYGIHGAVYALGTGSALIISSDYNDNPFKSSVTIGSVTEEIARAVSNSNHIINPDFKINQRSQASYSGNGVYSVDRWMCLNSAVITPTDSGLKVGLPSDAASTATAHVQQILENYYDFGGKTCTLSINISELAAVGAKVLVRVNDSSGAVQYLVSQAISSPGTTSVTFDVPDGIKYMSIWLYGADMRTAGETADSYTVFRWAKLEIGDNATPFIPPDPATELAKCQRYYQIRSTGDIDPVDLRPSMRATPTVTQLADGNYAYNAEL